MLNSELRAQFSTELNQIPMLQKQLAEIAGIPAKLDKLIERMERSNSTLASQVNGTMTRTAKELASVSSNSGVSPNIVPQTLSGWMKWTIVASVIFIAIACITNTVYNIWFGADKHTIYTTAKEVSDETDSTTVVPIMGDSVQIQPVQEPTPAQVYPKSQAAQHMPDNLKKEQNHP